MFEGVAAALFNKLWVRHSIEGEQSASMLPRGFAAGRQSNQLSVNKMVRNVSSGRNPLRR
jgi:hypothetical protein